MPVPKRKPYMLAFYDYGANVSDELIFSEGDKLEMVSKTVHPCEWRECALGGEGGLILDDNVMRARGTRLAFPVSVKGGRLESGLTI